MLFLNSLTTLYTVPSHMVYTVRAHPVTGPFLCILLFCFPFVLRSLPIFSMMLEQLTMLLRQHHQGTRDIKKIYVHPDYMVPCACSPIPHCLTAHPATCLLTCNTMARPSLTPLIKSVFLHGSLQELVFILEHIFL